jgi:hypothetical protein
VKGGLVQFKVPQNIDMADRIVGSLTLVQFLYLLIGGIVVYFLFTLFGAINITLFVTIAGPVALFALAMAFLKIQDQPFPKFVSAFFVYLTKPKTRIWFKEGLDPALIITPDKQEDKPEVAAKRIKRSQLDRLSQVLDTEGHAPISKPVAALPKPAVAPPNHLKKGRPMLDTMRKAKA